MNSGSLDLAGNLDGRASRVQNDVVVRTNQFNRGLPNPYFFRVVDTFFQAERIVDHRIQLPDRATVRTYHFSAFRQDIEIGAGSHCRDTKLADYILDSNLAFL